MSIIQILPFIHIINNAMWIIYKNNQLAISDNIKNIILITKCTKCDGIET